MEQMKVLILNRCYDMSSGGMRWIGYAVKLMEPTSNWLLSKNEHLQLQHFAEFTCQSGNMGLVFLVTPS